MAVTDGNVESGYISGNGVWEINDTITANALNNIENGLNNLNYKSYFKKYNFNITFFNVYTFEKVEGSSKWYWATSSITKTFNELNIDFGKNSMFFSKYSADSPYSDETDTKNILSFYYLGNSNQENFTKQLLDDKPEYTNYDHQIFITIDFTNKTINFTYKEKINDKDDVALREEIIPLYIFEIAEEKTIIV